MGNSHHSTFRSGRIHPRRALVRPMAPSSRRRKNVRRLPRSSACPTPRQRLEARRATMRREGHTCALIQRARCASSARSPTAPPFDCRYCIFAEGGSPYQVRLLLLLTSSPPHLLFLPPQERLYFNAGSNTASCCNGICGSFFFRRCICKLPPSPPSPPPLSPPPPPPPCKNRA